MKLLYAVSSGIDSMYMIERALEESALSLFVAHCNFHLRAEESDGDMAFIQDWCKAHGATLYTRDFDTKSYAADNGVSIEMAARTLRYDWFAQLCQEHGFDAVCVAHNADDNAETLLLNMVRGCGSRGLRGMKADSGEFPHRIIRPLLATSRREIRAWMDERGLKWREDSTNAEDFCKRNVLRHNVMPVLESLNPSYLRTFAENMERWSQTDDIAESYYQQARQKCILPDGAIVIKEVLKYEHWQYLLFRFTEGHLNADGLLRLKKSVESGRPLGGKKFGPYKILKGKMRLTE